MKDKKKKIIPTAQVALLAAVAGMAVNKLIKNVQESKAEQAFANVSDKEESVSTLPEAAVQPNTSENAEEFIEKNCPYLSPEGDEDVRYYIIQSINIGRYPHNDVQLTDPSVSRVQCRIFARQGTYYLVDMGATYPTELNGKPVANFKPKELEELFDFPLRNGDRLKIGRSIYTFNMGNIEDKGYESSFQASEGTVLLD